MHSKTTLIGNCGKDPEIKNINNTTFAGFTFATTETYKNKQGETVKNTEWHNITAWGKLADIIGKYVKKGALLYLEGVLHYSTYGEGEQKKYFTEIRISEMKMLGKKEVSQTSDEPTGFEFDGDIPY